MRSMEFDDLGLRLQRVRDQRKVSQDEMAAIVGVSLRYYQDLEQGRKKPSMITLSKMLTRAGVSAGKFFEDPPAPYSIPDVRASLDLLSTFANLRPEIQRMALGLIYDDDRFVQGISLPTEARARIQKLFDSLLKAPA